MVLPNSSATIVWWLGTALPRSPVTIVLLASKDFNCQGEDFNCQGEDFIAQLL